MTTKLTANLDRTLTIELLPRIDKPGLWTVFAGNTALSHSDTEAEAEQAKRAFENVLLPRFTRDEAIGAIHKALAGHVWSKDVPTPAEVIAFTLEALAVAGVFVDQPAQAMDQHASRLETMADKLDAGIVALASENGFDGEEL